MHQNDATFMMSAKMKSAVSLPMSSQTQWVGVNRIRSSLYLEVHAFESFSTSVSNPLFQPSIKPKRLFGS